MIDTKTFTVTLSDGSTQSLITLPITPEIRLHSQRHYAKAWNEALSNGMPLRLEIERTLEAKNLLDTDSDERKLDRLRKEIRLKTKQLKSGVVDGKRIDKTQGRKLALEIRKLRKEVVEVGQSLTEMFSQSVENYAQNEQMQYFVYACTVKEDGSPYWPSYDSFKDDTDSPVYAEAVKNFITSFTGIDLDYEKELYEVRWLIAMGYMDDELRLIDEKGRFVDLDGRLIDEKGRFINEDGALIDLEGNLIDENGNLLVEDAWGLDQDESSKEEEFSSKS